MIATTFQDLQNRFDGPIPAAERIKALYGVERKPQTREQLETIIKNNKCTALSHVKVILEFRKTRHSMNVLELGQSRQRSNRRRALLLRCLQSNRKIKSRLAELESQPIQQAAE